MKNIIKQNKALICALYVLIKKEPRSSNMHANKQLVNSEN